MPGRKMDQVSAGRQQEIAFAGPANHAARDAPAVLTTLVVVATPHEEWEVVHGANEVYECTRNGDIG